MSGDQSLRAPDTRLENLGPDASFEAFYRAIVKSLVGFLILQGASIVDAAEIAQDTMTRAYQRWEQITHPKAWSYRVASRTLIRNALRTRESPVAEFDDAKSHNPLLMEDQVRDWEIRHDLVTLISKLPPRQRQVLAWTLSGYTPAEIADALGIPSSVVRSNLFKARRTVASQLSDHKE